MLKAIKTKHDHFLVFSTGRKIPVGLGIIGIDAVNDDGLDFNPDDEFDTPPVVDGFTDTIENVFTEDIKWDSKDRITRREWVELYDHMIERWTQFKNKMMEKQGE